MFPPIIVPKVVESHMNIPIYNNVIIPGESLRSGAYLVQAVVAPKINHNGRKR